MRRYIALIYFALGCLVAAVLMFFPVTGQLLKQAENLGYLTAFIGGLMYSSSFTAATGSIILAHVHDGLNPVLAAIIGGASGSLYDLLIYGVINREVKHRPVLRHIIAWMQRHRRMRWTGILAGAFVIASPLPDELGIALLGSAGTERRWFVPLAFGLNTLGILFILEIF